MTEKGEIRPKRERALFFVCCIVCLFYPFLCHLTLPSSHLQAASALSLSSSLLWFYPPLSPYSFSLFCQASTQIWWPLLFSPTYHVLPFSGSTFTSASTIWCSSFPLSDFTPVPSCPLYQNGNTLLCFVCSFRFNHKHKTACLCK